MKNIGREVKVMQSQGHKVCLKSAVCVCVCVCVCLTAVAGMLRMSVFHTSTSCRVL